MPGRIIMEYSAMTHAGRTRANNEDAYWIPSDFSMADCVVVADGMGGYNAGELASRLAVEVISNVIEQQADLISRVHKERLLHDAMNYASRAIYEHGISHEFSHGMGTTAIAGLLEYDTWVLAHVGDSRCYYISGQYIHQVTRDHSMVEEMVQKGLISRDQAIRHPNRNIITQALGVQENVEPDFYRVRMKPDDCLLLCTDGLTESLRAAEIMQVMNSVQHLEQKTQALVDAANQKGGLDNITVVLIRRGRE